eukprot:s857_g20.t1
MVQVVYCLDEWMQKQDEFQALLASMDITAPAILWADDIAVPAATKAASQLVPFLQSILVQVRHILQSYGFSLNFAKGKTSAVLALKGPQSADLRRQFLLHQNPGVLCEFPDGASTWLHFVAAYKHLGTVFASNHDLQCELRMRVGLAKTAFSQLSRPILTNRNMPVKLRLQMFNSLIATKLFFGLGAWITPTPKQLQYLQGNLVTMLKKVLRTGQVPLSAGQVFAKASTGDVRARLALERLMYSQRLFRTGPDFLHHLLHIEFSRVDHSWLHGLKADLAWMHAVDPSCLPSGWDVDMTELFDVWQRSGSHWKRTVTAVWKKHLLQERIIADAKMLHGAIFRTLRAAGASFTQPVDEDWHADFPCFCGKSFASQRGLLAHQRRVHNIFSIERQFLSGCTCLHCGKFLWSTQRLQQHLSYIPKGLGYNPCFHALQSQQRQVSYSKEDFGRQAPFAGLNRRDALQTSGPSVNPQTAVEARRIAVHAELERCRAQLEISQSPDEPLMWGELIGERLTQVTLDWFHAHYPQGPDDSEKALLADAWVDILCGSELPGEMYYDDWLEMIFLTWGEHWLPEVVATLEDGVAEADIDILYADFAADLQRYQLLARVAHLELCLRECVPSAPTAHRVKPANLGLRHPKVTSQVRQAVPRAFALQAQWQQELRLTRFFDFPEDQLCPKLLLRDGTQVFLVLHLFSGRRRPLDVHHHLYSFAQERNLQLLVLSLDTAVSTEFGDLSLGAESWQMVEFLYSQGVVSATVVGSPCETFSEARFTPVEGAGVHGGPRPLRSAAQLFGLEGLTLRELRQCLVGGNFFQQAVLALGHHIAHGGCFISEHPAKPLDSSRPSVWTSSIVELLLTHPSATLSHVAQYRWGAKAIKPTGLLHYNLPYFLRDLYAQQDVNAQKPTIAAIGKDAEGRYRTSQHKEYPDRFCKGLAFSVIKALSEVQRQTRYRLRMGAQPYRGHVTVEAAAGQPDGTFRFVELFAGIGGFRWALEALGGRCVFASEVDVDCQDAYAANFGPAHLYGDITMVDMDVVPAHDLLTAGFPCQPFTRRGERLGFDDARGELFFEVLRVWNMQFLDGGHWDSDPQKCVFGEDVGYTVQSQQINAEGWVPQKRERLYFVGFRRDLDGSLFRWPEPPKGHGLCLKDILETSEAIQSCQLSEAQWTAVQSLGPGLWIGLQEMKSSTWQSGGAKLRLAQLDSIARTLTSSYKASFACTAELVDSADDRLVRGLQRPRFFTRRECARIMGFPEDYVFANEHSENRAYHQLGNAVCPPVIKAVAEEILKTLGIPSGHPAMCGAGRFGLGQLGKLLCAGDVSVVLKTFTDALGQAPWRERWEKLERKSAKKKKQKKKKEAPPLQNVHSMKTSELKCTQTQRYKRTLGDRQQQAGWLSPLRPEISGDPMRFGGLLALAVSCSPWSFSFRAPRGRSPGALRAIAEPREPRRSENVKMLKKENRGLQSAAGALWLLTGCMLMARGGRYFWQALQSGDTTGRAVSFALALGLCGGLAKGRFVLSKTALRNKRRLQRLENARPWQMFAPGFYPLILLMMGTSIALKKVFGTGFGGGMVTYGGIVTGIGSGLVVSSLAYWFESGFGSLADAKDENV